MSTEVWAIPPVRLGLSGRNTGKIPERPRKRSQSFSWNSPQEYAWDPPNPIKAFEGSRAFPEFSPPQYGWGRFLFQKWFRRGPLRAGHGIPSSTGGISESAKDSFSDLGPFGSRCLCLRKERLPLKLSMVAELRLRGFSCPSFALALQA